MCGISGIVSRVPVSREKLEQSVRTLAYRGPDGSGVYLSADGRVGLGHRRLSFLDLSASGAQPMTASGDRYTVTFNGEIYNFRELRAELESLGHTFHTQTDTEVLLCGYEAWGKGLPARLKGMFAFAVYDSVAQTLFLARDRFGIKPLFYGVGRDAFVFGSETKALLAFDVIPKRVHRPAVALFLANRYVPTPFTLWEDIRKLPPAHWMEVHIPALAIKQEPYWKLVPGTVRMSKAEAAERIDALLQNSVRGHLLSDVQVGAFLSGGMDSTALVPTMSRLRYRPLDAFAIGFERWDDSEHRYARLAADALGADLDTLLLDRISLDTVATVMHHDDDAIADISILPTYAVSGLAATRVKAVLSGEGADECFGGYWWQQPARFRFSNRLAALGAKVFGTSFAQIKQHYVQAMSMGLYDAPELRKAFTDEWQSAVPDDPFAHFDRFRCAGTSVLKQIQYLDIHTFMSELILTKVDRASMAHSLEVRVPFLDHELVEFLFSLHEDAYFDASVQKGQIRRLLEGKVPARVYDRPKQGFVGPDVFYMDFEVYRHALQNGQLVAQNIIRREYVDGLLHRQDHWRLWKLFVLENWWRVWM